MILRRAICQPSPTLRSTSSRLPTRMSVSVSTRLRLLGPVNAGLDLLDPADQRVLALVEPGDVLALAGEFALSFAELDVAPHRHPVADVVGEQGEPVVI